MKINFRDEQNFASLLAPNAADNGTPRGISHIVI
jgi:hypothetical protein